MTLRSPPRLASWLLERFAPEYRRESLMGDLLEEYQLDRTRSWYWRQTGAALLINSSKLLRIVLRVLIGGSIVVGGIALAESNVPHYHVVSAPPNLEQTR